MYFFLGTQADEKLCLTLAKQFCCEKKKLRIREITCKKDPLALKPSRLGIIININNSIQFIKKKKKKIL